jgi:PAB1-binding protein PBP1
MREGNARMQAMQHAVEKQPHHMGPETILEDNEDESSDEEDALQNVLAAAGATAADRVGAASRGMENFIRSTRDLAQGVSALSLEPALSVRYATQLSQLADEGYDNVEVLASPATLLPSSKPTSRFSTRTPLFPVSIGGGRASMDMLWTCCPTYSCTCVG